MRTQEQGWAGHFCGGSQCRFHRNTVIDGKIIVSTVGDWRPKSLLQEVEELGFNRFYETMAFECKKEGHYFHADVEKRIYFDGIWSIDEFNEDSDWKANMLHDRIVQQLLERHTQ
jgi:hypothetical protein